MAMDDRLHQPYRMQLVPGMDGIFKVADKYDCQRKGEDRQRKQQKHLAFPFQIYTTAQYLSICAGWRIYSMRRFFGNVGLPPILYALRRSAGISACRR